MRLRGLPPAGVRAPKAIFLAMGDVMASPDSFFF
jgi:hypothetical protein